MDFRDLVLFYLVTCVSLRWIAAAAFATFISLIPPPYETGKQLFRAKILGSTAALVGLGLLLLFLARWCFLPKRFHPQLSRRNIVFSRHNVSHMEEIP
jgi:hypothetical protein